MKKSKPQIILTKREDEVLQLILAEKSTKEIARALNLSQKTIESHRSKLFVKLEVKNVVGLVKKAILYNLMSAGDGGLRTYRRGEVRGVRGKETED